MIELKLTYTDESSEIRDVRVESEKFVIGRHSQCDLAVADSRLSRRHLQIERYADVFITTDLGSSNGTKLNGKPLSEPKALADGDLLDLGGLEFSVTLESDEPAPKPPGSSDEDEAGDTSEASGSAQQAQSAPSSGGGGSIFGNFFFIAPLISLCLLVVLGLGILVYTLIAGRDNSDAADSGFPTPYEDIYDPTPEPSSEPNASATVSSGTTPLADAGGPTPLDTPSRPPGDLDEEERLRTLATSFMRSIALRDPNPVITSEPLALIKNKIAQYRSSAALGANLEDAVRSAPQISALAKSKNMKPEFVAAAALAKLGGSRGNVLATANSMIGILSDLRIQIGDAFANECAIIIAAYSQGESGQMLAMRDTMTKLATDNPETSSRKVRTIWFLKEKGKLSEAQFEFALRFLALGTIAQDPKSFGINAGPLILK
jgi:hypothetical protein